MMLVYMHDARYLLDNLIYLIRERRGASVAGPIDFE